MRLPIAVPAAALLLLLLAASLAVPAQAAEARVTLEFPVMAPLVPGEERTVPGNLTYRYEAPSANTTRVTLVTIATPEWLHARVAPAGLELPALDPSGVTLAQVNLTVGVRAGTPALEQHTVRVELNAAPNPPLDPVRNTADVAVRVAYVGRLQVEPVQPEVRGRPGDPVNIPLRLTNLGNGPARVTLEPGGVEKTVTLLPPGALILETEAALRERVVNVSVLPQSAGLFNLVVLYSSGHAFDPTQTGPSGQVSLTLRVADAGVPGGGALAPLLLAAVLLPLLARRRR